MRLLAVASGIIVLVAAVALVGSVHLPAFGQAPTGQGPPAVHNTATPAWGDMPKMRGASGPRSAMFSSLRSSRKVSRNLVLRSTEASMPDDQFI